MSNVHPWIDRVVRIVSPDGAVSPVKVWHVTKTRIEVTIGRYGKTRRFSRATGIEHCYATCPELGYHLHPEDLAALKEQS